MAPSLEAFDVPGQGTGELKGDPFIGAPSRRVWVHVQGPKHLGVEHYNPKRGTNSKDKPVSALNTQACGRLNRDHPLATWKGVRLSFRDYLTDRPTIPF